MTVVAEFYLSQYQPQMPQMQQQPHAFPPTAHVPGASVNTESISSQVAPPGAAHTESGAGAESPFDLDFSLLLKEPSASKDTSAPKETSAPQETSAPSESTGLASIDPALLEQDTPHTQTVGSTRQPQDTPSLVSNTDSTAPEDPSSDDEYEEDNNGNIVKRTEIRGRHVSSINNFYDDVEGVGRGSQGWSKILHDQSHTHFEALTPVQRLPEPSRWGPSSRSSETQRAHIMPCYAP